MVPSSLAFDRIYAGWYSYYTFELGRNLIYRGSLIQAFRAYLTDQVLQPLPVASGFALFYLISQTLKHGSWRKRLFHWFLLAALTLSAFLLWINGGSYYNNLIPQHLALAILFGCGMGAFIKMRRPESGLILSTVTITVLLLGACQFAAMRYSPSSLIPTPVDRRAGDEFVALMRSYPGEILVPFHGYLPTLAGKQTFAQRMAIQDIVNRTRGHPRDSLIDDIRRNLAAKRFSVIITDHKWFEKELLASYDSVGVVFQDTSVFWPVTGWRIRPTTVYVPKPDIGSAEGSLQ